jgi:hypothetical protein
MLIRSNILPATQLALRHITQKYFNDSQERSYLFLWRGTYELMVENLMKNKIAAQGVRSAQRSSNSVRCWRQRGCGTRNTRTPPCCS